MGQPPTRTGASSRANMHRRMREQVHGQDDTPDHRHKWVLRGRALVCAVRKCDARRER